jgi:hypothetical protein
MPDAGDALEIPGPLPAGWVGLDQPGNSYFNDEIAREVPNGHLLWGEPFRSVARAIGSDDVLVEVQGRWALVHLTYKPEPDPRWPAIQRYGSWEDAIQAAAALTEGQDTTD